MEELEKKQSLYPFSIIIDETLDIGKKEHYTLLTQYWDERKKKVECWLHSVTESSLDQSADGIFAIIDKQIIQKPYGKIDRLCNRLSPYF